MTSWKNDHGEELLFVSSKVYNNIVTSWFSRVMLISGSFLSNVGQQFELLNCQYYVGGFRLLIVSFLYLNLYEGVA